MNEFKKKDTKYFLGLDLGIGSVGWAVMAEISDDNNEKKYTLHDFGVHLFNLPGNSKNASETNSGTEAEKRREFRSQRRLIRRRKHRIERIQNLIQDCGLSKEKIEEEKKPQTNKILKIKGGYDVDSGFENVTLLKYRGLREKITPAELYKILVNYANQRGYLDKFSIESDSDDDGFKKIISDSESLIKGKNISEVIIENKSFRLKENDKSFIIWFRNKKHEGEDKKVLKDTSYRWLFPRKAYEEEMKNILKKQISLHKNDSFWKNIQKNEEKIFNIIFFQRDFEMGAKCRQCQKGEDCQNRKACSNFPVFTDLIGKCIFYPEEERGTKSSLLFLIWNFVLESRKVFRHFESYENTVFPPNFNADFLHDFVFSKKLSGSKAFLKEKLKSFLKEKGKKNAFDSYFKGKAWKEGVNFSKEKHIVKIIQKIPQLYSHLEKLEKNQNYVEKITDSNFIFNLLGEISARYKTPSRARKEIINLLEKYKIKLSEEQIESLRKAKSGRANVSFKRMKEQIDAFLKGDNRLGEKEKNREEDKWEKKFPIKENKRIFSFIFDPDMQRNPVVFRAVNESRKVLKALHKKYGSFSSIAIEIARDVSKKLTEKRKITERIKANEALNFEIEKELEDRGIRTNSTNILKLKLFKIQKGDCIYCGKTIDIEDLKSGSMKVQIDHIIPASFWSDDSIQNKVLVCSKDNQEKGNRLPLEFLKGEEKSNFINRVEGLWALSKKRKKKELLFLSWKKYNYLKTKEGEREQFEEFVSSNLNDTRYISKWFSGYVKSQIKGFNLGTKVISVPGNVTSILRREWLFDSPWGLDQKVRDITPFHHAVDAMILCQITGQWDCEFAVDLIDFFKTKKRGKYLETKEQQENLKELIKVKKDFLLKKWNKRTEERRKVNLMEFLKEKLDLGNHPLYISDLKEQLEQRIPVVLTKKEKTDDKNNRSFLPLLVDILNKEEWEEKNKGKEEEDGINLRFPIVSWKQSFRIRGQLFGLENFGFRGNNRHLKNKIAKLWLEKKSEEEMLEKIVEYKVRDSFKELISDNSSEEFSLRIKKHFELSGEEKNFGKIFSELENIFEDRDWKIKETEVKSISKFSFPSLLQTYSEKNKKDLLKVLKSFIKEFEEKKNYIVVEKGGGKSILSTEVYYGIVFEEEKYEWINRYDLVSFFRKGKDRIFEGKSLKKIINKKQNLVVQNSLFEAFDNQKGKNVWTNFLSKGGENMQICPNSLSKQIKKENQQDSQKYLFNMRKNSDSFFAQKKKLIKIDILGNLKK